MSKFYKAAISHWEAQRDEAVATLELYFLKAVGIGEHSEMLNEINKWTHKLAEADENLNVLEQYFEDDGYVKEEKKVLNG
tara:strand:- start:1279 stop:1518 length:240 start_codon:yes stop_codon:yes gene_type:complete